MGHVPESQLAAAELIVVLENEGEEVVGVECDGGAHDEARHGRRPPERRERQGEAEQRRGDDGGGEMVGAV